MFSEAFLHTHFFVKSSEIRNLEAEKQQLTFVAKFDSEVKIPVYRQVGDYFGYPRYLLPNARAQKVQDFTAEGRPIKIKPRTELYPNQKLVMRMFVQAFAQGKRGFVLDGRCGSGKTVLLLNFLVAIGKTALVIVPKTDLIEQWRERISEHTDLKPSDVGFVEGRNADWKGKSIVVALVHSLGLDYLGKDFRDNWGVVAYDECHASTPPKTFSPISSMFPARYRIGASATLKRSDGLHSVFEAHMGEVFLQGQDCNRMPAKIIFKDHKEFCGTIYANGNNERRGQIISRLAGHSSRIDMIVKDIAGLMSEGHKVAVLSDRTLQLFWIGERLVGQYGIDPKKIGFYCRSLSMPGGGTRSITNKEMKRVADECDTLLGTFGMLKQGTDIPELSALVLATPQSNVTQAKGRIERFLTGKLDPVVIDYRDTCYEEAIRWARNREREYRKEGLEITWAPR